MMIQEVVNKCRIGVSPLTGKVYIYIPTKECGSTDYKKEVTPMEFASVIDQWKEFSEIEVNKKDKRIAELEEENEKLRELCGGNELLLDRFEESEKENAELREVLEYYSRPESYFLEDDFAGRYYIPDDCENIEGVLTAGMKARQTLAKHDKGEG